MSTRQITTGDKMFLMLVLFIGYMSVTYVRELVTYSAPVIAEAEHLTNKDLGLIVSSQKLGYMIIKFVGGTMVDVLDPGIVFSASLALNGIVGIGFTACSSAGMFSLTWFISGLVQGPAWPAVAVLLRQSFLGSQFSTCWSILSSSSNVASSVGPLISQSLNSVYPWRTGFIVAGTVSIVFSLVGGSFLSTLQRKKAAENEANMEGKSPVSKPMSVSALLNPIMLVVYFVYLLFSIVRGACNDWSQHYVIQDKKQSILTGGRFISSQEVGGLVGSIIAGYLSDVTAVKDQHQAMPRLKTLCLYSFLLTVGLCCLVFLVNSNSSQIFLHTVSFVIGFALYGCITVVGILCMDVAPSHLAGTSLSMGTLAANVGRVLAGYPLTMIASYFSWHQSFITTLCVSALSVVVCVTLIPMVRKAHLIDGHKKQL